MKEEDILRTILRETQTGWWQVDLFRQEIQISDMLQSLLGLSGKEVPFDKFKQFIPGAQDIGTYLTTQLSAERIAPLDTPHGREWLAWKVIDVQEGSNGPVLVTGYVRRLDRNAGDMTAIEEKDRVNALLYRLNSISYILLSLLRTDDTVKVTNEILGELLTIFKGGRSYIIEFDFAKQLHVCTHEVTAKGVKPERDFVCFSMDDIPWWTQQIMRGRSITLSTLDDLPSEAKREREVLEAQQICSMIVVPLMSRDKVWGYAGIDITDRRHDWSDDDCLWFTSLVNIIGLCLELQRSEQEARDERSYLQALYQHMPLAYVRMKLLYDQQGEPDDYVIVDANYSADAFTLMDRSQYIGRRASEIGVNLPSVLPGMVDVLRTGKFRERDTFIEQANRYIHSILYSIRKDEVISLFSDQSEIHEAHEVLDRNEKLLRNIFDNIQVGVELYDKDGYLVDLNNKDMEIFGVNAKEDVLGINFFRNPNVPVEIRNAVQQGRDQAFRINYPFDRLDDYYSTCKTGFLEIFTTVNMLYDRHGAVENFMLINIDNTEINRAHTRLAEFESSFSLVSRFGKVGYCRFDLLTKQGYGVAQWYRNLGEREDTPLDQVIGVYSHVDPADRKAILDCIGRVKAGETDSFSLDLRINSEERESWTRINVMRNPLNNDPSKIEMVCVNYDITELKLTEHNLIEAKNKAEVSDRLKSAFLANMSHEIRTPLNAIVGFSNLLTETDDAWERREYMRIVDENNDLLLKLISDILDLSKIEAGTFEFNYGSVDVNQMCDEAVRTLGLKAQGRDVQLLFGDHEDTCYMIGDKNRLMQVINNFLNNALKFTETGSITLDYTRTENEICFSVTDTGTGIPEEQLESIFNRFVKLNNFVQGTGLGLPICKSIVEQMGGRIGVESQLGAGSRFWFTVPVGKVRSGENASPEQTESLQRYILPANDGKQPLLLIAEDTDSNYLLVSLMLRKEYEIVRACNGEEAVRLWRDIHPDIILMDIQMPVMDGLDATRAIRAEDTSVPIVAITAYAYDRDRQKALEAGCDDYLTKPLSGDLLRQRLRELIQS